jgi:hypothetical protein
LPGAFFWQLANPLGRARPKADIQREPVLPLNEVFSGIVRRRLAQMLRQTAKRRFISLSIYVIIKNTFR